MKVEKLMHGEVGACRADDKGSLAAKIMWERDCGCVPVLDQSSHVIGMVTDRDLCMASYTQGKSLRDIPVRSAMSKELWSCRVNDDLSDAERTMREHQIRRLPVIDANGNLKGILSLADITREAAREALDRPKPIEVSYTDVAETLGAISVHRSTRAEAKAS
jgi:CBS domain-containing protein